MCCFESRRLLKQNDNFPQTHRTNGESDQLLQGVAGCWAAPKRSPKNNPASDREEKGDPAWSGAGALTGAKTTTAFTGEVGAPTELLLLRLPAGTTPLSLCKDA